MSAKKVWAVVIGIIIILTNAINLMGRKKKDTNEE